MGVYPDNDDTMWLTDTANVGRGKNGDVSRVVVHVTAGGIKNANQARSAYNTWSSAEVRAKMGVKYLTTEAAQKFRSTPSHGGRRRRRPRRRS